MESASDGRLSCIWGGAVNRRSRAVACGSSRASCWRCIGACGGSRNKRLILSTWATIRSSLFHSPTPIPSPIPIHPPKSTSPLSSVHPSAPDLLLQAGWRPGGHQPPRSRLGMSLTNPPSASGASAPGSGRSGGGGGGVRGPSSLKRSVQAAFDGTYVSLSVSVVWCLVVHLLAALMVLLTCTIPSLFLLSPRNPVGPVPSTRTDPDTFPARARPSFIHDPVPVPVPVIAPFALLSLRLFALRLAVLPASLCLALLHLQLCWHSVGLHLRGLSHYFPALLCLLCFAAVG